MSMKPQNEKKENSKQPNLNNAILIKCGLQHRGLTQRTIANELGITEAAVSRSIRNLSQSQRVKNWVYENLGIAI